MIKIGFISGHRDITQDEFNLHYIPTIDEFIAHGCTFVIGDCEGVDFMAQTYLAAKEYNKVTVYHQYSFPNKFASMNFELKGNYRSDVDRDWAMTMGSDIDIAWVREGKERSGTAQNLFRRNLKDRGVVSIQEVMTIEAGMWL